LDAWYANPTWHHYRCWEFYIPSTGGFRISGQANFYPQHSNVPRETDWDSAKQMAHGLTQALRRLAKKATDEPDHHMDALQKLTKIFGSHAQKTRTTNQASPQTLSTPTTPAAIRQTPRVHAQKTRNNSPGILPVPTEGAQQGTAEGDEVETEERGETGWHNEPKP
jgi:hypothetical protein